MSGDVFVNLVSHDLPKARAFYEALGFTPVPEFSNDDAASFKISPSCHIHLLTAAFMGNFTDRPIADLKAVWGTVAMGVDSKDEVDALAEKVLALGGGEEKEPTDMGWMYGRTMRDLDGHIIEFAWMSPDGMPSE